MQTGTNKAVFLAKRIFAFVVDYVLIGLYAVGLYVLVNTFGLDRSIGGFIAHAPLRGQLVGFLLLTLPVALYFVFLEKSPQGATLGKRMLGLRVLVDAPDGHVGKAVLIRNVLKFLPWEIAHFGVHQLMYFEGYEPETPLWVWAALILPQLVMFTYFVSIVFDKEGKSVYDRVAGTRVVFP